MHPDPAELRIALGHQLTDYMVPADCVMSDIPVSRNGKVNQNGLPRPESSAVARAPSVSHVAPRNPTEGKLAEIFLEVLNLKKVGVHDDFFNLGGHSLTALSTISLINSTFGSSLTLRTLFHAHTVSELAEVIDEGRNQSEQPQSEEWPILIPIQPKGSRPPLFCVARPNVNAIGFLFLSRELGPDQPLYGLQKQIPEDPVFDFSPEQLSRTATEYIQAMRAVQPRGPYYLTGMCQGAYIAFEMTRQLEAEDQQVGLLGMLDVWPEENTRIKWLFFVTGYIKAARNRLARLGKSTVRSESSGRISNQAVDSESAVEVSERRRRRYWPGANFKSPVVRASITVFRVAHQSIFRRRDEKMGWSDWTRSGVEVEHIPGEHHSFLRDPFVRVLASALAARIPAQSK
jgi:thioesterase domain-containing protein